MTLSAKPEDATGPLLNELKAFIEKHGDAGEEVMVGAATRTKAMDELIAGDADLYDVPPSFESEPSAPIPANVIEQFARDLECGDFGNVNGALNSRMCCNGHMCGCRGSTVGEYLAYELRTASARIKRDKDRENPVERPQLEYDHTQEGTANFERALLHASYHEVEAERLTKALERANAQTEQFERDYYLKCDEHERDLKDAAAFMGKRDAHIGLLTDLAYQYLSDLRYPPSSDSRDRRIERIEAVLKEVQP